MLTKNGYLNAIRGPTAAFLVSLAMVTAGMGQEVAKTDALNDYGRIPTPYQRRVWQCVDEKTRPIEEAHGNLGQPTYQAMINQCMTQVYGK